MADIVGKPAPTLYVSDDDDDYSSRDDDSSRVDDNSGPVIPVGQTAPRIYARASDSNSSGYEIEIINYIGKRWLLILFYPVLDKPVYLQEIQEFGRRYSDFISFGCDILVVVGESQDEIDTCLSRPTNQGGLAKINFAMVGDVKGKIAEDYKAINTMKYIIKQATILVDQEGIIHSAHYYGNQFLRTVKVTELITKSAIQASK